MPCDPQELVSAAACIQCGIPDGMKPSVLIALLCRLSENGGGGASPLTVQSFPAPAFPFVYTATRRAIVEVNALFNSGDTGSSDTSYTTSRTGVPDMVVSHEDATANLEMRDVASYRLGPGDSITLTNTSAEQSDCTLLQVTVYSE